MVSPLIAEQRRHWRMTFGLIGTALVAGVSVSNERGVFVPIFGIDNAIAATARAFAAIAAPGPLTIDSIYTAPFPLARLGSGAPQFQRVVDVPGVTRPNGPVFAQQAPFAPNALNGPAGGAEVPAIVVNAPAGALAPVAQPLTFASLNTPPSVFPGAVSQTTQDDGSAVPAVPEPASWALMIAGFALIGACLRRFGRTRRLQPA